jgi:UDP-glucose 4-epimerase
MTATWRAHLQPSPPGWLVGLAVPTLDSSRARDELGWEPSVSALDAFLEVVDGMRDAAGEATPPLDPVTSGPMRERELVSGVGSRDDAAA